jgi:DNA invertase Pin-like site-specific DNA recombinase
MFQMLGVFAEFERAMTRERVKVGLERTRAQGKTLGRPTISVTTDAAIRHHTRRWIGHRTADQGGNVA